MMDELELDPELGQGNPDLDSLVLDILDDSQADESLGRAVSFGILATLLSMAGVVEGATFRRNMERQVAVSQTSGNRLPITKSQLGQVVRKSRPKAEKMAGKWEWAKAMNVVARTLYMEARGEGQKGLEMVMTVIWNRAGGDVARMADVCLQRKQFSCWNAASNRTPSSYSISFPSGAFGSGPESKAWAKCQNLANLAFSGNFSPTDSHWNSYYNPTKADPSWASDLVGQKTVGNHVVGELRWLTKKLDRQKAASVAKPAQYVVQKGDTLWKLAKANKTTVQRLKELNGLKSDGIEVGQTLRLS